MTPTTAVARAGYAETGDVHTGDVDHAEQADPQGHQGQGEPEQDRAVLPGVPRTRRSRRVGDSGAGVHRRRRPDHGGLRTGLSRCGVRRGVRRWAGGRPGGRALVAARDEGDYHQQDHRQRPREPEPVPGLAHQEQAGQHRHADQRRHQAALVEVDGGPVRPLLGKQQPQRSVEQQAGAAEEREDDQAHAHQHRVDIEVPGQAAGDAGDLAVGVDGPADAGDVAHLRRR